MRNRDGKKKQLESDNASLTPLITVWLDKSVPCRPWAILIVRVIDKYCEIKSHASEQNQFFIDDSLWIFETNRIGVCRLVRALDIRHFVTSSRLNAFVDHFIWMNVSDELKVLFPH